MTLRRVVFDTSTLVSAALRPDSVPFQALHTAFRFCDVCASRGTLAELKTVLTRTKVRRYLPDDLRRQFVEMMENHVRLFVVRDEEVWAELPACRDPKDNQFLTLAFACEANAIVTSDDDLLVLDPWGEIRILRAAGFLHELKQGR
jgi:putative PIN family toxin of toxin-antitoxin system